MEQTNKSHIIFAKKCNKWTNLLISSVITDILFLSSPCDQMLIKCAFSCVVCRKVLLLIPMLIIRMLCRMFLCSVLIASFELCKDNCLF